MQTYSSRLIKACFAGINELWAALGVEENNGQPNGRNIIGSLYDTNDTGFLAFIRLVGTMYLKKYHSAMASLKGVYTPQQLFNAQPNNLSIKQQHVEWYNEIQG